jgi:hypothetical protein
MIAIEVSAEEDWVVCCGETRAVTANGLVACPMRDGAPVSADACSDCHLLEWHHDERERRASCAIADRPRSGTFRQTVLP